MGVAAATSTDIAITPRDIRFLDAAKAPRWWHGGDPVATAFWNAVSATFPEGERYFIETVKRYRDEADPTLRAQIAAFIRQESVHTREHIAFNRIACERGYDLARIDAFVKRRLEWARGFSPMEQLASTMALEHFTAILAHEALANPIHFAGVAEPVANLWRWHALEEIEHKAVAYDTFLAATRGWSGLGRWLLRTLVMITATRLFLWEVLFGAGEFFGQDGLKGARVWGRLARYLLAEPGILRRIALPYCAYYRPGFHPWRIDDRALIAKFDPELSRENRSD